MLDAQWGECAICHQKCKSGNRLSVDHDHATGKVRALLCHRCNAGLTRFESLDGWGRKATAYLKFYSTKPAGGKKGKR